MIVRDVIHRRTNSDAALAPESQDSCVDVDFDGGMVKLVGINTGIGVDGNDKFCIGFQYR